MTWIAYMMFPNLPIALAHHAAPALAAHPLVLYTVAHNRAFVYAASAGCGVLPGQPLRQAQLRCPQASYQPAVPAHDAQALAAIQTLLLTYCPRLGRAAPIPDPAWLLDLGALHPAQARALAMRLRAAIQATLGLAPAIGLAANCLVARHAAQRAGPGLVVLVPAGQEAAFLAPMPIARLDLDAELVARLAHLGLHTIGDLARIPTDALQAQFGGAGTHLAQLARGDDTPMLPTASDAPACQLRRSFAGPLLDGAQLDQALAALAARLAAHLLADGWAAGTLMLTFELDEGVPLVLAHTLAEPSSDAAQLAQQFHALRRQAAIPVGVTAIQVAARNLVPPVVTQLALFAPTGGQAQRLHAVLDRLAGRFAGSLLCAHLAAPHARLPERRVRLEPR